MTEALPPGVSAAWGLRERAAKGPRPGLSRDRILEAAISLAAAEGLAAVSMPRLARELGSAPMSLYRHVSSKDELLALMRDRAMGTPPPIPHAEDWRTQLSAWAHALLKAMYRHPWSAEIPVTGLPVLPHEVAWIEQALQALADTGLAPGERMSVLLLVSGHVRISAISSLQLAAAFQAFGTAPSEVMARYSGLLRQLTTPQDHPALTEILASGVLDKADDPLEEFTFGLNRILDGIQSLIHPNPRPPS